MSKRMSRLPTITLAAGVSSSTSLQTATNPQIRPDHLNFVEGENSKLKDEIRNLKKTFQAVHVQPASPLTPTPRSTQPRKSLTPKQLRERVDFDLDTVELDHVGNKLLRNIYKRGWKGEEVLALDQEKNTQRQLLRQMMNYTWKKLLLTTPRTQPGTLKKQLNLLTGLKSKDETTTNPNNNIRKVSYGNKASIHPSKRPTVLIYNDKASSMFTLQEPTLKLLKLEALGLKATTPATAMTGVNLVRKELDSDDG
ncbi:hypothetical protein VP01_1004g14 [Puccinia sorghi]|uniref:Uncharacterized protein n=1 Tax=Puccinia sorghi TaxID=27349 RepID=A0A0L6VVI3_9BASI|nr:hypothetical protein VP01_1004g14 [Puccinia sorghi]